MVEQAGTEYPAMKPEVKLLWLTALLSGAYEQANGQLRDRDNAHCCLGVLCDISEGGRWTKNNNRFNRCAAMPPKSVYQQTGLRSTAAGELATMNDRGDSFEEIAAWIDANL